MKIQKSTIMLTVKSITTDMNLPYLPLVAELCSLAWDLCGWFSWSVSTEPHFSHLISVTGLLLHSDHSNFHFDLKPEDDNLRKVNLTKFYNTCPHVYTQQVTDKKKVCLGMPEILIIYMTNSSIQLLLHMLHCDHSSWNMSEIYCLWDTFTLPFF
jgi:hypothetical protein